MNPTVALTGMLPAILILSAAVTAPLAWFILRSYRAAVMRSMRSSSKSASTPVGLVDHSGDPPVAGLPPAFVELDASTAASLSQSAMRAFQAAQRSQWRTAAVYVAGGGAYGFVHAVTWMLISGGELIPVRFLWLFVVHCFPAVLAAGLVAFVDRKERVLLASLYLAILLAVGCIALVRNPGLTAAGLIFFFLGVNVPAVLLLIAFLRRNVRAVGPLVLSFVLTGVAGAFIAVQLAGASEAFLRGLVAAGGIVGLGARGLFVLLHAAGFAAFAVLGWRLLGWVGRRYEQKRISEQSLTIDSMVLLFSVVHSVGYVFDGWAYVLAAPGSVLAFKLAVRLSFRLAAAPRATGPVMLLLRVFALGPRSEALFRRLSLRWLHSGSIALIAGPDLATATVEPHEFFAFLGRRLARQFIEGPAALDHRLSRLDLLPDPDGRYRVNEFFCHRDTWQVTMTRLAGLSQAVLMDLRGFSPANQGCRWELEQLLASIPLGRVLFVIDGTTDVAFLREGFAELCARIPYNSPNRHVSPPQPYLFRVSEQSGREIELLLQWLYNVIEPQAQQAVAV